MEYKKTIIIQNHKDTIKIGFGGTKGGKYTVVISTPSENKSIRVQDKKSALKEISRLRKLYKIKESEIK